MELSHFWPCWEAERGGLSWAWLRGLNRGVVEELEAQALHVAGVCRAVAAGAGEVWGAGVPGGTEAASWGHQAADWRAWSVGGLHPGPLAPDHGRAGPALYLR